MTGTLSMASCEPANTMELAEARLLARLSQGDVGAFDVLVTQYQDRVAGLAWRLLGWRHDVEDVVQDVFLTVLQKLPQFRGESRLTTWLYRITVNRCRRERRKRLLRRTLWRRIPNEAGHGVPTGQALEARERHARVRAAVGRLASRYQEVVVLRYLEELPVEEIGAILELGRNAVEVRLSRARNRLRGALADLVEE